MRETSVLFPKNLDVFPSQSQGKHLDSRETKQMFPEGAVIKSFVIYVNKINHNC